MSDRLQELRVTVTDTNRMVEVTVDSSGSLVDLSLGERTQRVAPEVVARTIMATIREAKGQLAEKSKEIIADTLGTESVAAREIADRVEQQLTPPDPAVGDPGTSPHRW
nr:YbaB/EbfC family nucleoid-associated protein [Actinoplanes palleronii]